MEAGIDISDCPVISICLNQLSCIWVNSTDQERTILMHKDYRLSLRDIEFQSVWLDDCDALYIDGHEPLFSMKMAMMACEYGMPVIADTEKLVPHSLELLKQTTAFIAPLRIIFEKKLEISVALANIAGMGPSTAVATMGNEGLACFSEEGYKRVPAQCVRQSTQRGAGDVFMLHL